MRIDPVRTTTVGKYVQREIDRPSPHNMTVNLEKWAEERWPADESGQPYVPHDNDLHFDDSPTRGETHAGTILLVYGDVYQPSYTYDAEEGIYIRHYNGKAMGNAYTGAQYAYSDVIVQACKIRYCDGKDGHACDNHYGQRPHYGIHCRQRVEGTWICQEITDSIEYVGGDRNPLLLARGLTFAQMVMTEMHASDEWSDVYTFEIEWGDGSEPENSGPEADAAGAAAAVGISYEMPT